jgi:hypothetical protein
MPENFARSKKSTAPRRAGKALPILHESCSFEGYDAGVLMNETEKLRELITKEEHLKFLYHYVALQIQFVI